MSGASIKGRLFEGYIDLRGRLYGVLCSRGGLLRIFGRESHIDQFRE